MNNLKNCWTVYFHTTPSGKRYIGITSKENAEKRWRDGKGYKNTRFGKAIEKYGWDKIQHNIVSTDLTEKEAKWLENYLICYYWTFVGFKDSKGYNCTLGGDGQVGWHPSKETRRKQSEAKKGKTPWMKGKHHTEETRRKQSEAKKGKQSPKKGIKTCKSAWNRGIPRDDKTKRKISESHKGKTPWNKGKHITEETRRKYSESHKGQIPWNIGIPHTEESKNKMSESRKGKPCPTKGMHRVYHEDGTFHFER